jgi:hypothetical protein
LFYIVAFILLRIYCKTIIYCHKPQEKNFLPVLLQNIEADCILDYSTKLISKQNPEIPLFTIHDSIVTTSDNIEIVEKQFRKYLRKYFGIIPELKREPWVVQKEEEKNLLEYDKTLKKSIGPEHYYHSINNQRNK